MLPNNKEIVIGNERFRCSEILFQPQLIGRDSLGLHDLLFQTIQRNDIDTRKDLFQNIVLAGGTTMLNGLPERLYNEISRLTTYVNDEVIYLSYIVYCYLTCIYYLLFSYLVTNYC